VFKLRDTSDLSMNQFDEDGSRLPSRMTDKAECGFIDSEGRPAGLQAAM
jgi:hypothetical protein